MFFLPGLFRCPIGFPFFDLENRGPFLRLLVYQHIDIQNSICKIVFKSFQVAIK